MGLAALSHTSLSQLLLNIGLAFVGFIIFYVQAFILLRAVSPSAPISVLPVFPIITLSTILPLSIGGVGIREWTAVLLLSRFNITPEAAITAFFGHFVVVQLLPSLVGVIIISNHWSGYLVQARRSSAREK